MPYALAHVPTRSPVNGEETVNSPLSSRLAWYFRKAPGARNSFWSLTEATNSGQNSSGGHSVIRVPDDELLAAEKHAFWRNAQSYQRPRLGDVHVDCWVYGETLSPS